MQTFKSGSLAMLIVGLGVLATARAADNPEDVVKYRHAIMEAMASHASAFQLLATGKIGARQHLRDHADAIANMSGELDFLFPEGSDGEETLPAIWEQPEKFSAAIAKMQEAASKLSEAAGSDDRTVVLGGLTAAGKACKGCHESFREEHEDDSDD